MMRIFRGLPLLALAAVVASGLTSAEAGAQAAGNAAKGGMLFKSRCAVCHTDTVSGANTLGPNLYGVLNRKAGSNRYRSSPALKASGLTFNTKTLDAWLAAPAKLVPGTRMVVATPKPADRADLIAYLSTLTAK